jgi:hypothetical protein
MNECGCVGVSVSYRCLGIDKRLYTHTFFFTFPMHAHTHTNIHKGFIPFSCSFFCACVGGRMRSERTTSMRRCVTVIEGLVLIALGVGLMTWMVLHRPSQFPSLTDGQYTAFLTAVPWSVVSPEPSPPLNCSSSNNNSNNYTDGQGWVGQIAFQFAPDLYCYIPANDSDCDLSTLVRRLEETYGDVNQMSIVIDASTCNLDYWWRPMVAIGLQSLIITGALSLLLACIGLYMLYRSCCCCRCHCTVSSTPDLTPPRRAATTTAMTAPVALPPFASGEVAYVPVTDV